MLSSSVRRMPNTEANLTTTIKKERGWYEQDENMS